MWPFKSKPKPLPETGDLQTDLKAMDFAGEEVALLFEFPGENDSEYWGVDDPDVLASIADNSADIDPQNFFSAAIRTQDPKPYLPGFIWLLKARELHSAYHLSGSYELTHSKPLEFLSSLGPKACRVTWSEPYLRGRAEIEAMQERLWVEDDLFALEDLPDTSELQHDFTHAFRLRFPPTDQPENAVGAIKALMEQAFPGSSDLYILGRVDFEPYRTAPSISIREQGQLNAVKNIKVSAPRAQIFQPEAWVYCEQAFYDHADRNIANLMGASALLSDAYQQEVAEIAQAAITHGKLPASQGEVFLNEGTFWLKASAGMYRPQDFPFRYFQWPKVTR